MLSKVNSMFALIALSFSVCSGTASANQLEGKADKILSVTVRANKSLYEQFDDLILNVVIKNNSPDVVYLYKPLKIGGHDSFSVWLKERRSKKWVPQPTIYESAYRAPLSEADLFPLKPGESHVSRLEVKLLDLGVDKGQTYDLIVNYRSPVTSSESINFNKPILTRESGDVSASTVIDVSKTP